MGLGVGRHPYPQFRHLFRSFWPRFGLRSLDHQSPTPLQLALHPPYRAEVLGQEPHGIKKYMFTCCTRLSG